MSKTQGEGWGSHLALFETDSYTSARSDVPHAEEITPMTCSVRRKPMPKPQYCAQQEYLRYLARLAGVNAVTVRALGKEPVSVECANPRKDARVVC